MAKGNAGTPSALRARGDAGRGAKGRKRARGEADNEGEDDEFTLSPPVLFVVLVVQVLGWTFPNDLTLWFSAMTRLLSRVWSLQRRSLVILLRSRAFRYALGLTGAVGAAGVWWWVAHVAKSRRMTALARKTLLEMRAAKRPPPRDESHSCPLCETTPSGGRLRILALEGGGIRGVLASRLLSRLLLLRPNLIQDTHLIAGTSTGAFIATCLADGRSPEDSLKIYALTARAIFSNSWRRVLFGVGGLWHARYGDKGRSDALECIFGDTTLGQLQKHVLVPTMEVSEVKNSCCHPHVFTNLPTHARTPNHHNASDSDSDSEGGGDKESAGEWREGHALLRHPSEVLVHDVLMATSAAPTFFPSYLGHVDGGLFANNPSIFAVSTACDNGVALDRISVLCLSCGDPAMSSDVKGDTDWGILQWVPRLIRMLFQSSGSAQDKVCRMLLGPRYHRWRLHLPSRFQLDCVDDFERMVRMADDEDITKLLRFIDAHYLDPSPIPPHHPALHKAGV